MDHPQDIPRRRLCISLYKCLYCDHWWEAEGWCEGSSFETNERCPECDKEQG